VCVLCWHSTQYATAQYVGWFRDESLVLLWLTAQPGCMCLPGHVDHQRLGQVLKEDLAANNSAVQCSQVMSRGCVLGHRLCLSLVEVLYKLAEMEGIPWQCKFFHRGHAGYWDGYGQWVDQYDNCLPRMSGTQQQHKTQLPTSACGSLCKGRAPVKTTTDNPSGSTRSKLLGVILAQQTNK
jgi:hypothetical protein